MEFAEVDVKSSSNRRVRIYPIGDMHLEKIHFDEDRAKRYFGDIVKDPHGVWVFLGDAIEGRTPSMDKYDIDVIRPEFRTQEYGHVIRKEISRIFSPLKARPGFVVKGNHDEYLKYEGIARTVAEASGGQYLDGEGMFRLNVDMGGKAGYVLGYARHITGGGRTPGAKINSAYDMQRIVDADIYLAGHVHSQSSYVVPRWKIPRRRGALPHQEHEAFAVATALMHNRVLGVVDYAGKKGYAPTDNGLVFYEFDIERRRIRRLEKDY